MSDSTPHFLSILLCATVFTVLASVAHAQEIPPRVTEGRFGGAFDLESAPRSLSIDIGDATATRPFTLEMWARTDRMDAYNILAAAAPKSSSAHWEIYTRPGDATLAMYLPQVGDFPSARQMQPGTWHFIAMRFGDRLIELYIDGEQALSQPVGADLRFDDSTLMIGAIPGEALNYSGAIDDIRISHSNHALAGYVPNVPMQSIAGTLAVFPLDAVGANPDTFESAGGSLSPLLALISDPFVMPEGDRFLDEVQQELYDSLTLHGDRWVEYVAGLPVRELAASSSGNAPAGAAPRTLSLDGNWKLKGGQPGLPPDIRVGRHVAQESEGTIAGWYAHGLDRSDWLDVTVPTSVQSALLAAGEIEDPFWDDNTFNELMEHGEPADGPWTFRKTRVEQQEWWFVREFTAPADWDGGRVRLHFDGIDYSGSFYLNNRPLGHHAGMFGGPEYDVTNLIRPGEVNTLAVAIDPAPPTWYGIMKGSPGFGWHYGHLISMGIWRGVELQHVPDVELVAPFMQTRSIDGPGAAMRLQFDIDSILADPTDVTVTIEIEGANFDALAQTVEAAVAVPYGRHRYAVDFDIDDARLWWPVNYGDQNLYRATVTLEHDGEVTGRESFRFGVRTIRKEPLLGQKAEIDYRWQLVVNDTPIFMKGANWCWTDPMLELDVDRYEHMLELARRANIMMFRAWGGGIVEHDTFYEKADEKGILIYQEVAICWTPPDFPATDAQVFDQQIHTIVERLRNHPSLVMWGGANEAVQAQGGLDEPLTLVGRRCRQLDPTRPFHRTSPWGGSYHNWGVFHGGLPIDSGFLNTPSVMYAEFGIPTMENYEHAIRSIPAAKLETWPPDPDDGGIIMHLNQFSLGDIVKVMRYGDYGPIDNWRDYIEYGQMAQGDEFSFVANLQRSGSYLNKAGLWIYKMGELFPGQSWGVVGFHGAPKISYYRTKQFFTPQAAFLRSVKYDYGPGETFKTDLHVANDTNSILKGATARLTIYGSDLQAIFQEDYTVPVVPSTSRVLVEPVAIEIPPARARPFLAAVELIDTGGNQLSNQWTWYNFRNKTGAVERMEAIPAWGWPGADTWAWDEVWDAYAGIPSDEGLLALPRAEISATAGRVGMTITIEVKNVSDKPAFNVLVDGIDYQYGMYLSDNSFFLHPGESRTVTLTLPGESADPGDLVVRAWNADTVDLGLTGQMWSAR